MLRFIFKVITHNFDRGKMRFHKMKSPDTNNELGC